MTPELRKACEIVFQEHRASAQPVKWNLQTFHGRISLGLTELAKDTLIKKNIIVQTDKSKKTFTQLNPAVTKAANFEEAEELAKDKKQVLVMASGEDKPVFVAQRSSGFEETSIKYSHRVLQMTSDPHAEALEIKWYYKPIFYYLVWPLCAVAAGILISFLLDFAYTELFLHFK